MVYEKSTFLWLRLCIPNFRTLTYIVDKQSGICWKYLLLQGLCVSSVKTTTYVCNRFKMNLNEKFWNKPTLIWVGFLGVCFTPLLQRDYKFENHTFIWIRLHILHLVYTTSLTNLCFNKKFELEKKSSCKSISKSIHVDTANIYLFIASDAALVFSLLTLNIFHTFFSVSIVDFEQVNVGRVVIYNDSNSMWRLVTFNEIFFLSLQKGGGIACVNYLKVKNDVTHSKAIITDKSQIHASPNFSLLSS